MGTYRNSNNFEEMDRKLGYVTVFVAGVAFGVLLSWIVIGL